MQKTIQLALNAFPATPSTLLDQVSKKAVTSLRIDLAELYQHYYHDIFDRDPPDPDPAHFEQVRYLATCADFRFLWYGQGVNKSAKGNKSYELGQAFCRWFMSSYLDITYFAHIDDVRDHGALPSYGGVSVVTTPGSEGLAPDYFCATGPNQVYLAEAKGTRHAVGFKTKEFAKWRAQFNRVQVVDPLGNDLKVKGYIVAMRWAFEGDSPKIMTKLSAEDPETPGERALGEEGRGLAYATKSLHYVTSLERLRQPLMAAALARGIQIPPDLQFNAIVWKSLWPPLDGHLFVGGYFPKMPGRALPYHLDGDKIVHTSSDPLRLDIATGTFVGIELGIFKTLAATARNGPRSIADLQPLPRTDTGYSGISFLRDGQVLGPVEFFIPVQSITL